MSRVNILMKKFFDGSASIIVVMTYNSQNAKSFIFVIFLSPLTYKL